MDQDQAGRVRFTYLHGDERFLDVQDTDGDGPTLAARVAAAVPRPLLARIDDWDRRMGEAFDHPACGEGRPPEDWPATLRESLTREYDALLAELHALGLPVVRDAWWASETHRPASRS
ncbi:hypothetical protein M3686_03980 [Micrococcus luteus]|uniref:hypothetical protein n=1 Tax=Micrococcus luteus TaxID=1270 RepID=UPI00203E06D1|nr:hypothetical protein [Micrococcus luteus]MCM3577301.1 hypothetical protein [Micrococcus luteus]MCV7531903.1 hypothetical protein [Micrococcus luteus]